MDTWFFIDAVDKSEEAVHGASSDSPQLSPIEQDSGRSTPPRSSGHIWKGEMHMVDVAHISITAHEVSGRQIQYFNFIRHVN